MEYIFLYTINRSHFILFYIESNLEIFINFKMGMFTDTAISLLEKDNSMMCTCKKLRIAALLIIAKRRKQNNLHVTKSKEYHHVLIIFDSVE